jgi:hypothetical protein
MAKIPQCARAVRKHAKLLLALALALSWTGCGKPGVEHLADARSELADGAYDDAISAARDGLAAGGEAATIWGLELVLLEAHARSGHGPQTKELLTRLGIDHPDRIPPTEYTATAHQLKTAGDGPTAIEVLDLGAKRYPDNPIIAKMIGDSASAGSDPAELEMLRSLGYIE